MRNNAKSPTSQMCLCICPSRVVQLLRFGQRLFVVMIKKLGTHYFLLSLDISRFTVQTVKLCKARRRVAEKITCTKFSMLVFTVNANTS